MSKEEPCVRPLDGMGEAMRLGGTAIPADKIRRSWELCSLMFPEQAKAWTVHANSPLVFSTVWATMSLFKTSAHVSQKLLALATFATMTFRCPPRVVLPSSLVVSPLVPLLFP